MTPMGVVFSAHIPIAHFLRTLCQQLHMVPEPAAFGIIFDLFTGLRIGELCGLQWENVNLEHRCFKACKTRTRLPNFDDSIKLPPA